MTAEERIERLEATVISLQKKIEALEARTLPQEIKVEADRQKLWDALIAHKTKSDIHGGQTL